MKASEVLRRYAAGERDFRRANLQGQSFQKQDLSGADFSGADIRGANFSYANLKRVNFSATNAGLIHHRIVLLVISCLLLAGLGAFLQPMFLSFLTVTVLMPALILFQVSLQGVFTDDKAAYKILDYLAESDWQKGYKTWKKQRKRINIISALLVGCTCLLKIEIITLCIILAAEIFSIEAEKYVTKLPEQLSWIILSIPSVFIIHEILNSSARERFMSFFGSASFEGSDLADANFSRAILVKPNFNASACSRVCWYEVKNFGFNFVSDRYIVSKVILKMKLLIDGDGENRKFNFMDLEAVNLCGANLKSSSFIGTNLNHSNLQRANLKGAILMETNLIGADLTGAYLTGACLEAWNIDNRTILDQVDCQYVYLLRNQQERRPSSGDFAPGEFTKLFQEVLSTVDLIFRNGVDWKAFVAAFQQVQVQNEETPLEIQSIENKGDGVVVVRVSTSPHADKEKIHSEFNQQYELALQALEAKYRAELQAKETEITIYREQSGNMWSVINSLANRPINVQAIAEAKAMNDSTDQSQSFKVGGDFTINATNSVVNLRDISGTVTHTISQLPDSADSTQPSLKDLLTQLQRAIESETDLPDPDKADLLEQVKTLAEVPQTSEPAQKEGLARKAKKMFEATLKSLPDTAKIVEACSKLLPLILKALGLPI